MHSSISKLNSTFGTIGKATADKKAAKVVGKLTVSFHFSVTSYKFNMLSRSEAWL